MSKPPVRSEAGDPLEPVLRDIEAELRRRLHEACRAEAAGISSETTVEIRQLEDSLLAAAVAAEQTIALRRHIERRRDAAGDSPSTEMSTSTHPGHDDTLAPEPKVREFRDDSGQLWRAWPVAPAQLRHGKSTERYLGDFHKGWICFEALESTARRRLPGRPVQWSELSEAELARLLDEAISAPARKPRTEPANNPPGIAGRPLH